METEIHVREMLRLFDRSIPDMYEICEYDVDLHIEYFLKEHVDEIRCTYYSVPRVGSNISIPERVDTEIVLINIPGLEKEVSMTSTGMFYTNHDVSCYHRLSHTSQMFVTTLFDMCHDKFPKLIKR